MQILRHLVLACAIVGASASFTMLTAEDAKPGRGEKVTVETLPDAVKATFAKEAPDAKEVYKSNKDGKDVYRAKITGADGKALMLIVGADGAVISKNPARQKGGDKPAN
jgi:hypothetical protein